MKLPDQAAARYHKILDGKDFQDTGWAQAIHDEMVQRSLAPDGRPVCPVMRPHFVTRRQYEAVNKAASSLYLAIERIRALALTTPALLNRLEMLPAEKMLAAIDPGYPYAAVTSLFDTQLHNGSFRFVQAETYSPAGVVFQDALADIFQHSAPMKVFRKHYKLTRVSGMKRLLHSLLAAYKAYGKERKKFPRIGIIEFRPPAKHAPAAEHLLMAEYFREAGFPTEVVTPDQLDYRNGLLCRGDFGIDIAYRMVSAQEFLVRFSLAHPLLRAYRDGAVCLINSFRTELLQKKALFALLTDDTVTSGFPAAERKSIRAHIPWTRVVQPVKTTFQDKPVDLPDFILANREGLVLKPNDASDGRHSYRGWETNDSGWEQALRSALRTPYVVQERVELPQADFPVFQYGRIEMRRMEVEVQPHIFLGKPEGCSTQIRDARAGFSTLEGIAPTFLLK